MTIQEAVNKAVEGGYHMHGTDGMATVYTGANSEYSAWTRTDNHSSFPHSHEITKPTVCPSHNSASMWSYQ